MHGEGIFTYPDGRSYKGQYKNNFKHGYGVYTWSNGRVYSGNWKDGK